VFGLVPALQASRCNLPRFAARLRQRPQRHGRACWFAKRPSSSSRSRSPLLFFHGRLIPRSFRALQEVRLGFEMDHVLSGRIPLPRQRYQTGSQLTAFFRPFLRDSRPSPESLYAAETSTRPPYGGIGSAVEIAGINAFRRWHTIVQLCSEELFSSSTAALRRPFSPSGVRRALGVVTNVSAP